MVEERDPALLVTLSEEEISRTLRMTGADLESVARTIAANPGSTIEPAHRASSDARGRRAVAGLAADVGAGRGIMTGLDMGATIGEGGMGIVRMATQRSLGRTVAVKTLREGKHDDAATLRLLREAWVTGTLEHPNIVPVYDLGLDETGTPVIVLKRIEGVEWAAVMRDPEAVRARYGAKDLLEYNLRILVQLCNAVSLAHARGVLHRDLKPENVMIGSFGEVYLVDWGIAVSLDETKAGRLPLAAEQNEIAGTPCYMAPEMLGALGTLSARTDVYLLGAILHEILAGAPPHGGTFRQIVASILLSSAAYPPEVPGELAAIAQRAMARQPADRFASADELRQRLEWYLGHRGSLAISAEAQRRLEEMRALVAAEEAATSKHDALYRLFTEARFGFRQALSASPENEAARSGLREAIETMVRFELARGAAEAAAGVLAELEEPPPALVREIAGALEARADEKQKMSHLTQLAEQLDPSTGRRTRVTVAGALGIVWIISPQLLRIGLERHPTWEPWRNLEMTGVMMGVAALLMLWGRQSLMKTQVNRRIVAAAAIMFGMQLVLELGLSRAPVPGATNLALHLVVWATTAAWIALGIDRRCWPATASYCAAFLVAMSWPALVFHAMSAGSVVLLVTVLVAWWRPAEDRPRFLSR
ncbi:MAG: serine/threonine protein kinase [Labilithrix sp.]|nr:serine/threonine protein kinase [Labilithrix sp.]